ncbi:MAG: DUF3240 family protein [Porticoccaceae bacterium]|nr:DUF3240 family protein [Porticoccaceae bacterium]
MFFFEIWFLPVTGITAGSANHAFHRGPGFVGQPPIFEKIGACGHGVFEGFDSRASPWSVVRGRRKRVQFEIIMAETEVQSLIARLTTEVRKGIGFWQFPVSNTGRVNE